MQNKLTNSKQELIKCLFNTIKIIYSHLVFFPFSYIYQILQISLNDTLIFVSGNLNKEKFDIKLKGKNHK